MTSESGSIRRILAATDFSETAEAGVEWAVELARSHGAAVYLVHGLMLPNQATDFVPSPPNLTEEIRAAALARLDAAAGRVRATGIPTESELRLGIPSMSILEAAEEHRADLIVIGTRGLSGLTHLLLGSTAERVVQRAACPVLSVHPGDIDQPRQVRTILVPTDFSDDAVRATHAALELLQREPGEAKLILLHVYHLPFEYTAYGMIPTTVDFFKDAEGAAQARLEEAAAPLLREGLTVETRALEGYPAQVIAAEAEEAGADLIAIGTHGRSALAHLLLGSTADRVVQHAHCPVLTVRGE